MGNYERMSIIRDSAELTFDAAEEFQSFLNDMDKDSDWIEVEKNEELVVSYAGCSDDVMEGLTDETFNDTVLYGTKLQISYNGNIYYVGSSALPTLKSRAGISGTSLEKISREDLADILNKCLPVSNGGTLMRVCGDKVRACHSKNYQTLSESGLFRTARASIEGYSNKVFVGGVWNHDYMKASWNINDKDVIKSYIELFTKMGIPVTEADIKTVVTISTSDVGTSGATVWYNIDCNSRVIVLGNGYKLNHKGNASLSDFADNLRDVFASYKQKFYDLEELKNVEIKHPVGCVYGLLRKADMPPQVAKDTALRYNASFGNGETNALNVYVFGVCEALGLVKEAGASISKMFTYEEKIARVIGYDFKKCDKDAELLDL
jgi:hypothetical protein